LIYAHVQGEIDIPTYIRILKLSDPQIICENHVINAMYSLSTKVEYATDITLRRIVRLKSYQVQRKKVFGIHSQYSYTFLRVFKVFLE
jgi:ribosomal protein S13